MQIPYSLTLSPDERLAWLAWSTIIEIGPRSIERLLALFGSLNEAWNASSRQLASAGLTTLQIQKVEAGRKQFNHDLFLETLKRIGITARLLPDPDYPPLLREIADPPIVLFCRGAIPTLPLLAVVGTRNPTSYGRHMTERLTTGLVASGLGIVSGLAFGIDSVAHQAALTANGPTVAIFASGLDRVYPTSNESLAWSILKRGGAWLSEYPPGTSPLKHHFPLRNRIIAGLCLGALIIEAGEKSGALITAAYALDSNREVFAVPGPVTSLQSAGTNQLIKRGANVVTTSEDVCTQLNITREIQPQLPALAEPSKDAAVILKLLAIEPHNIDHLIEKCKMTSSRVLELCARLELEGRIRKLDNLTYALLR